MALIRSFAKTAESANWNCARSSKKAKAHLEKKEFLHLVQDRCCVFIGMTIIDHRSEFWNPKKDLEDSIAEAGHTCIRDAKGKAQDGGKEIHLPLFLLKTASMYIFGWNTFFVSILWSILQKQ